MHHVSFWSGRDGRKAISTVRKCTSSCVTCPEGAGELGSWKSIWQPDRFVLMQPMMKRWNTATSALNVWVYQLCSECTGFQRIPRWILWSLLLWPALGEDISKIFKAKIVVLSCSSAWLVRIENDVIGEIGVLDLPLQRNYMHCFCELEGASVCISGCSVHRECWTLHCHPNGGETRCLRQLLVQSVYMCQEPTTYNFWQPSGRRTVWHLQKKPQAVEALSWHHFHFRDTTELRDSFFTIHRLWYVGNLSASCQAWAADCDCADCHSLSMHEAFSSGQELRGQTVERPEQRRLKLLKLLKLVCFVIVHCIVTWGPGKPWWFAVGPVGSYQLVVCLTVQVMVPILAKYPDARLRLQAPYLPHPVGPGKWHQVPMASVTWRVRLELARTRLTSINESIMTSQDINLWHLTNASLKITKELDFHGILIHWSWKEDLSGTAMQDLCGRLSTAQCLLCEIGFRFMCGRLPQARKYNSIVPGFWSLVPCSTTRKHSNSSHPGLAVPSALGHMSTPSAALVPLTF